MTALMEAMLAQVSRLPDEEQEKQGGEKHNGKAGSAAGMIWMAHDFDAPLEGFSDARHD